MFRLRIVATAIACSLLVRSVLAGGPSSGVLALSQDDKAALAQAAKNVREIIGHRGSMLDRPENTLASYRRAIEAGANVAECDVRTTRDGILVSHHDGEISRTSSGKGLVGDMTLAELRQLDFGGWFDPKFKGERIPTLQEILELCHGKIDVMLDLKESGQPYAERIAALVRKHGEPKRIVLGIRSVEHAKQFRKLLPEARQIGLVPTPEDIAAFADAGVETIRLWPKWLNDKSLVAKVRQHKKQLHLGTGKGTRDEVVPLLQYEPESLASDDPGRLRQTLAELTGK
jgi:glycerophosphoryl diester phosphodiesterase